MSEPTEVFACGWSWQMCYLGWGFQSHIFTADSVSLHEN